MQIRCNFPDISYLSEMQKNNFQFLSKYMTDLYYMGLDARKPVFRGFANNTGADQPAHPRSLISAFVIHFLERIISRLPTGKISIF